MKENSLPYTNDLLHSSIDYAKLIELQANAIKLPMVENDKQKTYQKTNVYGRNQRNNKYRESKGIDPRNH